MRTRQLGQSDLHLSIIGFGAWAIGGSWLYGWGEQDENESIAAIQRALDLGINWIDTAPVYGFGRSEEVVGKAIQGRRDQVIVATKCGRLPDGKGGAMGKLTAESVQLELEASLKRLGVDVIDLYQIHWPDPENEIPEAWKFIQQSIKAGKIRYAGVSNFSVEQMSQIQPIGPIASLQPPYSMLRRAIETEILPFCKREKIGVVAYSPMVSGLLTGKVTQAWVNNLPDDDWRKNFNKEFQQPNLDVNIAFVEEILQPIALKYRVDPGQIAIAWTLRESVVTSSIVGGRNIKQVEQTVRAASIQLTNEEVEHIEKGLEKRNKTLA